MCVCVVCCVCVCVFFSVLYCQGQSPPPSVHLALSLTFAPAHTLTHDDEKRERVYCFPPLFLNELLRGVEDGEATRIDQQAFARCLSSSLSKGCCLKAAGEQLSHTPCTTTLLLLFRGYKHTVTARANTRRSHKGLPKAKERRADVVCNGIRDFQ